MIVYTRARVPLLFGLVLVAGCYSTTRGGSREDDDDAADDDDATDDDDGTGQTCEPEGATTCFQNTFAICEDGWWSTQESCSGETPICDDALGCVACVPDLPFCDGNDAVMCGSDGRPGELIEECGDTASCVGGTCLDGCDLAEQRLSYFGCDFLAVSTANSLLGPNFGSDFAVVIANPDSTATAEVTVERAGQTVATDLVGPRQTKAIPLPMVTNLQMATQSVVEVGGAYEVRTSSPVAAYQYSPLHFEIGGTPSYTNDASLLLPEHVLTGNYMASTWPTWGAGEWDDFFGTSQGDWFAFYPSFLAVAAVEDGTSVTFRSKTNTAGGTPGALSPGGSATVSLNRGDVVQIFSQVPGSGLASQTLCDSLGGRSAWVGSCPPSFFSSCEGYCSLTTADLTGSTIDATGPVAVFAGHLCTFMPFSSWACDHLEEMMPPVQTWGTLMAMTAPVHPTGAGVAPTLYRVLALEDQTLVEFQPEVHTETVLDAGEYVEFRTDQDFQVVGSQRIFVTQAMLGEDELGASSGDPALGSGVPQVQFRDSYDFLTPDTYTANYVNIVAPTGTEVLLDGVAVTGWEFIFGADWDVARVALSPGQHRLESPQGVGFGITTYGYASYTSYLYPGGMNFGRTGGTPAE